MASIRILKKDINKLAFNLLQECFSYRHFSDDLSEDKFDNVIKKLVLLRNDLILRVNHPESDADSSSLKAHYTRVQLDLFKLADVVEDLKK
ncbi:MAG: hypothetical protein GY790_19740 [Bacteroidetes bacterium]|nr:hypothetical protein [Bacteroidota bacterium]